MYTPFLSIIIPVHNEENRLPTTLTQVRDFLCAQSYTSEVLIVENGSHDRTLEIAREFVDKIALPTNGITYETDEHSPHFVVLHENNRGKGLAVQRGMLEAHGQYRFMCDVDLSMPIAEINRFLPPTLEDYAVAIGSREAPGAVRYNEPAYRHLGGRLINAVIRFLALPGLQDTQCGFKCFRADAAEKLFGLQTMAGWSFDIEILFIARRFGYKIVEVPIPWYFNPDSKLNVVRDALQMGMDILTIRRQAMRGLYQMKSGGEMGKHGKAL